MGEENIYRNYTLQDIQQYLSGSMSPADMHALERAALQDPFLADAIEGFAGADAALAATHLNQIHAALQQEAPEIKPTAPAHNKNYWWRVAAMAILLVGAGITTVYLMNKNNPQTNDVAQLNKKVNPEQQKQETVQLNTDSTANSGASTKAAGGGGYIVLNNQASASGLTSIGTFTVGEEKADLPASSFTPAYTDSTNNTIAKTEDDEVNKAKEFPSAPVSADKTMSDAPKPNTVNTLQGKVAGLDVSAKQDNADAFANASDNVKVSGRVFDNAGNRVPNAVVNIPGTNTSAVTDSKGEFSINISGDSGKATVSAIGYANKDISLSSKNKNIIFLQQNNSSLDEVVVTTLGRKKEAADIKVEGDKKAASPVGGWDVYEGYVETTIQNNADTTGDVYVFGDEMELEFDIDANGNPYDISITSPLTDPELNKKIADAVAAGPRWIKRSGKSKAKLKIKF